MNLLSVGGDATDDDDSNLFPQSQDMRASDLDWENPTAFPPYVIDFMSYNYESKLIYF